MLTEVSSISHIYIACGHTDLRKSIDGLAAIVQESFKMNPFQLLPAFKRPDRKRKKRSNAK